MRCEVHATDLLAEMRELALDLRAHCVTLPPVLRAVLQAIVAQIDVLEEAGGAAGDAVEADLRRVLANLQLAERTVTQHDACLEFLAKAHYTLDAVWERVVM